MDDSGADPRLGRFVETAVAGEMVRAFVPPPLPPEPSVKVLSVLGELGAAERALGRLDGITALLPRHELFLSMYVRKEAVLSSQIEGTQSTLSDLLRFEIAGQDGKPIDDVREVSNYVNAMMYGPERLESFPLSLRLIREMHALLLESGRGATKDPGEFRRSQNWIGGTRPGNALFVPPPPMEMADCLGDLELFMHEEASQLPALIKAGLLHVQFETIHPFLDGNGRIGRLLVTLFLCVNGVLRTPLLYLSLYLKVHRSEYYQLLQDFKTSVNEAIGNAGSNSFSLASLKLRTKRSTQPTESWRYSEATGNASTQRARAPVPLCASTICFNSILISQRIS